MNHTQSSFFVFQNSVETRSWDFLEGLIRRRQDGDGCIAGSTQFVEESWLFHSLGKNGETSILIFFPTKKIKIQPNNYYSSYAGISFAYRSYDLRYISI